MKQPMIIVYQFFNQGMHSVQVMTTIPPLVGKEAWYTQYICEDIDGIYHVSIAFKSNQSKIYYIGQVKIGFNDNGINDVVIVDDKEDIEDRGMVDFIDKYLYKHGNRRV